MPKVAFIMGSDSDLAVLESGIKLLISFGIEVDARAMSAHRTPCEASDFASKAEQEGYEVIIAAAGMAAHLAGAMAAHSVLPIIGIPVASGALNGWDALLSTVMMPPGVPVATVGVNGGENAALLAIQMLSIKYPQLRERLRKYKAEMNEKVMQKDARLREKVEAFAHS